MKRGGEPYADGAADADGNRNRGASMRLFAALELNAKVIANLTDLVHRLGPISPVTWIHPENMHVTLKYIGDWDENRLDDLIEALRVVRLKVTVNVPLAGLGYFPSSRNPRVFWVGAENTPPLRQLASAVDAVLAPLGVTPEVRPYTPHLTLGRMKAGQDLTEMHEAIEELPSRDFGSITPDQFVLYESTLTPEGAIYRKVREFPFLAGRE